MSIDQNGTNGDEVTSSAGEAGDGQRHDGLALPECLDDFEEEVESEADPNGIDGQPVATTVHALRDPLHRNLIWTGHLKQTPVLVFSADSVYGAREPDSFSLGQRYHLTFKMMRYECKLVRSILEGHGLREAPSYANEYNVMWTGTHLKPYLLRGMQPFQRVNHFPRSYELTRKDRLFKNVQRMQHVKGFKHFDFLPHSYVMPHEHQDFCSAFVIDKGPYIVKPIASSRGRGIYLINHPDQLPFEDHIIVSKYINKPYLIDGFKFDIRLYVCVTSYDPLLIYLYEEGLVRFATVPYNSGTKHLDDQCMHLTNYSINKKNDQYVQNDDADVEDFGNKWSLGALLRYLKCAGKDVAALMLRLEDVIIKAIVSVELPVSTACKMFQPHRGNCFELYGFDIILDETLRPWVLEVNLSPSLACDAPLDLKIKTHMISHLLNLVGIACVDPVTQQAPSLTPSSSRALKTDQKRSKNASGSSRSARGKGKSRAGQAGPAPSARRHGPSPLPPYAATLSGDDLRMVRRAREEFQRRGGWLRIFPTRTTWDSYGAFMQSNNPSNLVLHQRLFPDLWADRLARSAVAASLNFAVPSLPGMSALKPKVPLHSLPAERASGDCCQNCSQCSSVSPDSLTCGSQLPPELNRRVQQSYSCVKTRLSCYERKLGTPNGLRRSRNIGGGRRGRKLRPNDAMVSGNTSAAAPSGDGSSISCAPAPVEAEKRLRNAESVTDAPPGEARPHSETSVTQGADDTTSFISDLTSSPSTKLNASGEDAVDWQDFETLISRGGQMTKFQARHTFTAYLSSVQRRLLEESQDRAPLSLEEEIVAAEQMELVVKFLRRASNHMRQPYKVNVPSRRLPTPQRKRVLSNVLNDFVHVYAKETVAMRLRMRATESNPGVNNKALIAFLTNATEKELEHMLATYTHANQSAGIFLDATAETRERKSSTTSPPTGRRGSTGRQRASAGDATARRSRSATPHSARSRSSSARGPRSRSMSATSPSSKPSSPEPVIRSRPTSRSRSAESPRCPRMQTRPRTASMDAKAARGRSNTRQTSANPPAPVDATSRRSRPSSRRRPSGDERHILACHAPIRSCSRTRLPAATLAVYSRTRSGPTQHARVGRLPPALPGPPVRRLPSARLRRQDLSVENIYDKIRYDAATGMASLRRSPPRVRRLPVD